MCIRDRLILILEKYILEQGLAAIDKCGEAAVNDPKVYVNVILDVHKRFNALIIKSFNNDFDFVAALDRAFGEFVNTNSVTVQTNMGFKSSELLAKYCDTLLKKSPTKIQKSN